MKKSQASFTFELKLKNSEWNIIKYHNWNLTMWSKIEIFPEKINYTLEKLI